MKMVIKNIFAVINLSHTKRDAILPDIGLLTQFLYQIKIILCI